MSAPLTSRAQSCPPSSFRGARTSHPLSIVLLPPAIPLFHKAKVPPSHLVDSLTSHSASSAASTVPSPTNPDLIPPSGAPAPQTPTKVVIQPWAKNRAIDFVKNLTPSQAENLIPEVFMAGIITPDMLVCLPVKCWPRLPCLVLSVLKDMGIVEILRKKAEKERGEIWKSLSPEQIAALRLEDDRKLVDIEQAQVKFQNNVALCLDPDFPIPAKSFGLFEPQAKCLLAARVEKAEKAETSSQVQTKEYDKLLKNAALTSMWKKFKNTFIPKKTTGKVILTVFCLVCVGLIVGSSVMCLPAIAASLASAMGVAAFCVLLVFIKLLIIVLFGSKDLIAELASGNRNDKTRAIPATLAALASAFSQNPIPGPHVLSSPSISTVGHG